MTTKATLFGFEGLRVTGAEAVLISAFIGGIVALLVVKRQRTIAKKAKAYDIAEKFFRDERIEAEARLREMNETNNWNAVIGSDSQVDKGQKNQIGRYLNEWELLCVAIRQSIAHEGVLKDVIGDRLVLIYMRAEPLIKRIRTKTNDDEYFEHFQYIADKWKANPDNLSRRLFRALSWRLNSRR